MKLEEIDLFLIRFKVLFDLLFCFSYFQLIYKILLASESSSIWVTNWLVDNCIDRDIERLIEEWYLDELFEIIRFIILPA